jgi:hypothetical protein
MGWASTTSGGSPGFHDFAAASHSLDRRHQVLSRFRSCGTEPSTSYRVQVTLPTYYRKVGAGAAQILVSSARAVRARLTGSG